MTFSSPEVIVALALTCLGGGGLLASLVAGNTLLSRIVRRLNDLQEGLDSIGTATEPLTGRISAIAGNVANLKDAVSAFERVLLERAPSDHVSADGALQ